MGRKTGLCFKKANDFTSFGVAPKLGLAKNEPVIHLDFKATPGRWDQGEGCDVLAKLAKEFVRQTDGAGCIVSLGAVFDAQTYLVHAFLHWAGNEDRLGLGTKLASCSLIEHWPGRSKCNILCNQKRLHLLQCVDSLAYLHGISALRQRPADKSILVIG